MVQVGYIITLCGPYVIYTTYTCMYMYVPIIVCKWMVDVSYMPGVLSFTQKVVWVGGEEDFFPE